MNEKQKTNWARARRMGKSKYLLVYGVIPWSLGAALLLGILEFVSQGDVSWIWIPIRLLIFAVAGFFVSNARWQYMERKYEASART